MFAFSLALSLFLVGAMLGVLACVDDSDALGLLGVALLLASSLVATASWVSETGSKADQLRARYEQVRDEATDRIRRAEACLHRLDVDHAAVTCTALPTSRRNEP